MKWSDDTVIAITAQPEVGKMLNETTSSKHSLDDEPDNLFDIAAQPILEYAWIDPVKHSTVPANTVQSC